MAIIIFFPFVLWMLLVIFNRLNWNVTNYVGKEIPYSLGLGILLIVFLYVNDFIVLFYLTTLWLTGFIDDRYGTKFPKGLKGHLTLFFREKKISTGLLKLICTAVTAWFVSVSFGNNFSQYFSVFLLLLLTPHIMNLFDTRPLRVWKATGLHALVFIPLFMRLPYQFLFIITSILGCFVYFEGTKKAMLGDNGATLIGGILGVVSIQYLTIEIQWLLIFVYFFIVYVTEKISLSMIIEKYSLLRKIDRWGVS